MTYNKKQVITIVSITLLVIVFILSIILMIKFITISETSNEKCVYEYHFDESNIDNFPVEESALHVSKTYEGSQIIVAGGKVYYKELVVIKDCINCDESCEEYSVRWRD